MSVHCDELNLCILHSDGTGHIPGGSGRRSRAPGPLLAGAARLVRLVRACAARFRGVRQPGGRHGARRALAARGRRERTRADLVRRLQVRTSLPRLGTRRAHTPLGAPRGACRGPLVCWRTQSPLLAATCLLRCRELLLCRTRTRTTYTVQYIS